MTSTFPRVLRASFATLSLLLVATLASADEGSQASPKASAKASASELEAIFKAEFKTRSLKRALKLVAEKKKPKKGKKGKAYQYKPRVLKGLYALTSPEFKNAFSLKVWTNEVMTRHTWLGYPVVAKDARIREIVIHREFASVYWGASFSKPSKGFYQDSQADRRLKEAFPDLAKKSTPSSVWSRVGKTWTLGVRALAGGKWEEFNPRGDPLRPTPSGFDPKGPSAAEVCARISASEDERGGAKLDRAAATKATEALRAAFSGRVIWDVGVIENIKEAGGGLRKRRSFKIRVGNAFFYVSDANVGSVSYDKVKVGSLVAFRGTLDRADRSPKASRTLEVLRTPYLVYLDWPRTKRPALVALDAK